jgi:translation elongation factor EF-Ts
MCTLDGHTRINHRLLDGQKQPLNKPFEVEGMKIRYPGDPTAHPSMVYNCRCTMVGDIDNYPSEYDRYDNIAGKPVGNMTYKEWEAENLKAAKAAEETVRMLDESEAGGLKSLFQGQKMSNLYNEMRGIDSKTATAFYNELKSMGKPSEIWNQYLNGTLPSNIDTSRLNGILQSYAEKKGLISPNITGIRDQLKGIDLGFIQQKLDYNEYNQLYRKLMSMSESGEFAPSVWDKYLTGKLNPKDAAAIDAILYKYSDKLGINIITPITPITPTASSIKEIFSGKKMSNVYNEIKAMDTKTANQFYNELKSMGKPSDIWQQYLDGKLTSDQTERIEKFLNDYANKAGLIKPKEVNIKSLFSDKKMSAVYNEIKGLDTKSANRFYKQLQSLGKPSEVWQRYLDGTLPRAYSEEIDQMLKEYANKAGLLGLVSPEIPTSVVKDKKWLDSQIPNDIFYNCAAKEIKNEGYRKKMIDLLDDASDDYKDAFLHTLSEVTYQMPPKGKGAFYRDSDRGIRINLDKTFKRDDSLGTLFHETGHAMDYAYMRLRNKDKEWWEIDPQKDRTSQLPKFISAIEKDLKFLSKNIDNMNYHRDIWDDASKGVQDFFSALKPLNDQGPRKGKIPKNLLSVRYNWSHDYDYYTRYNDPMIDAASELWANISGGRGDYFQGKYMKKYFPNACEAFDEIVNEMAKMLESQ